MSQLDTGIVFAYFAMMILVGIYASRQQSSVEDYFVASGRIGTVSIACLWLASYVGGAAIIGGSGKAYDLGVSSGWYVASMVIGCVTFGLFFAKRIKRLGNERGLLTYPELIESHYDSRTRIVSTITTVLAFIGFAAGQIAAAAGILSALLGWDFGTAVLLASAIIVAYTALGGFLAITYTDWIQVALLFAGVVVVGLPLAIMNGGTPAALATQLPPAYFNPGNWGWPTIFALVVSITLSFYVAMDSFTRMFAARNEGVAQRGTLLAAVLLVPLGVGATWLGMTAALLFPGIADSNAVLTHFVVELFPIGLKGLMLVALLAALMSTADICILTATANLSHDVYKRYVNPDVEPRRIFRLSMGLSVLIGAVAALMAWGMQDIINILLVAFTINSAALFLPTLGAIYRLPLSREAAFWSMTLSLATVIGWYFAAMLDLAPLFEIDPLWPGLAVSLAVIVAGTVFTAGESLLVSRPGDGRNK